MSDLTFLSSGYLKNLALSQIVLAGFLLSNSFAYSSNLYQVPSQEKWGIIEIANDPQAGGKICALSNNFVDGSALYLAGNSEGLKHISVDFPSGGLIKGKDYSLRYSIPGMQSGEIQASALSDTLLAGKATGKDDFSVGLRKALRLDVTMNGQAGLHFKLDGFEQGYKDFKECISDGVVEVVAVQAKAVPKKIYKITESKPEETSWRAPPPPEIPARAIPASVERSAAIPSPRPKPSKVPRYTEKLAQELIEQSLQYTKEKMIKPAQKPKPSGFLGAKTQLLDVR